MRAKDRIAVLCAVVLAVGSAVAGMVAAAALWVALDPGVASRALTPLEIAVGIPALLAGGAAGAVVGSALWIIAMRPLLSAEEARAYVARPHVPIVTPVLVWLFARLYHGRRERR